MNSDTFSSIVHATLTATPVCELLVKSDAVILERIAMGGGATRWYYCQNKEALDKIETEFRPGSVVSFYFDHRIANAPYSHEVRTAVEEIISIEGEAVVGRVCEDGLHMEVDFVAGPNDIDDFVAQLAPSTKVFYGEFPARDNDGLHAVTVTIPDLDGVVREHPH